MKLISYIRGGIGDTWIAISALKKICEDNKINKFDRLVVTDSCYYFRDYPKEFETYNLDIIRKLTNNVIQISPQMNNNFWLTKNNIPFDDTTNELTQQEADKYMDKFMFWRPQPLRHFVGELLVNSFKDDNTIFVDCPFTECIMMWDFVRKKYERISNDRAKFEFNPGATWKTYFDILNTINHVIIHIRQKQEGDAYTEKNDFYQKLIYWCKAKNIYTVLIGVDGKKYDEVDIDLRGSNRVNFEEMGYLINIAKVFVGNDSGFSTIKLYQQQKDNLLIMNHNRFERSKWVNHMLPKSNCLLLDAKEDNFEKIIKVIGDYYEIK